MSINVKNNIASLNALNALNKTTRALSRSFERISTGERISRAADDAAGLGVATNLESQAISVKQAMRNTNDGISVIQTAESAANEVTDILQRVRELAVQSASDTLSDTERAYIGDEYDQLISEVDRIANATNFNGLQLTDGSGTSLAVQVGITSSTSVSQISITLGDLTSSVGLGLGSVSLTTATAALAALDTIDTALSSVNQVRSNFGAVQNRLESSLNNSQAYLEALSSAQSQIEDLDFASETANLTKLQILQQSGVAALAQAKNINQSVISLLQ